MRWFRCGLGVTSVALAAGLVGCTAEEPPVHPTATVSECEASFSELESALAGDPNIAVAQAHAYTLSVCTSREQWVATAAQHDQVLGGQTPESLLDDLCGKAVNPAELPACSSSTG